MQQRMPENGLNENHRRRLAVAMAMIDAAAARILDLLDERTSPTRLSVLERSIDEDQREQLRQHIHKLQPLTAELAHRYGLEKHRRDLRRTLTAELSQMWTIAEDCVPEKLHGMGQVGSDVEGPLRENVMRLVSLVRDMQRVLASSGRRQPSPER